MDADRVKSAIARIEAAAARIEAAEARTRPTPDTGPDTELALKHEALKATVEGSLRDLDALIAQIETESAA